MCDIDKKIRSERYNILRSLGYSRGWAQRARDFTNIRFERSKVILSDRNLPGANLDPLESKVKVM